MKLDFVPWWGRVLMVMPKWLRVWFFQVIKWYCLTYLPLLKGQAQEEIGGDYLHRWWIKRDRGQGNHFYHKIMRSDEDRALHDHPWDFVSFILDGSYVEVVGHGYKNDAINHRHFYAGDVNIRRAEDAHRLVIAPGSVTHTLVFTGGVRRDWGFHCEKGWKHWRDFCDPTNPNLVGHGCGD